MYLLIISDLSQSLGFVQCDLIRYKLLFLSMSQDKKLFVYGVDANCPREVLEKEFGRCGRVTDIYNTGKGYAFITMNDENAAKV